jgi:hypothetical protein
MHHHPMMIIRRSLLLAYYAQLVFDAPRTTPLAA